MQAWPLLRDTNAYVLWDGAHTRALAQRLLQGCGWFAVCIGALLAVTSAWVSHGPLASQPVLVQTVFSDILMGRGPTFLVALFVLFRLNFHWVTQPSFVQAVLHNDRSPWGVALACALAAVLCWCWLLLSTIALTGLALELQLGGHAHATFSHLLTLISPASWVHDGLRLWVIATGLAWISFIEVRFLGAHQLEPSMALSRAMVLGLIWTGSVEAADFVFLHR